MREFFIIFLMIIAPNFFTNAFSEEIVYADFEEELRALEDEKLKTELVAQGKENDKKIDSTDALVGVTTDEVSTSQAANSKEDNSTKTTTRRVRSR